MLSITRTTIPLTLQLYHRYHVPKHLSNDLLLLRHAQSFYNVTSEKYIKQNGLQGLTWDEICQVRDFNLDVNYNARFIDSDLSEKGVIQVILLQLKCFSLREELLSERIDFDLILCSPLVRALRTCRHVFDSVKVKKVIVPELTQVLRYACDISNDIAQKKEQFPEYDWSLFLTNDNFWFLNSQSLKISQTITTMLQATQPLTYKQAQYQLLLLLYEQKVYESDLNLRARANKVKQMIAAYRKEHKQIVVISHHYLLQHLLAQGYRGDSQPITGIVDQVPNAMVFGMIVGEVVEVG